MPLTGRTSKSQLTRVLVLLALLCTGALQVQEAGHGHWHELDERYSQCLVCKSSGAAALPVELPEALLPGVGPTPLVAAVAVLLPGKPSPFDARGPPDYA